MWTNSTLPSIALFGVDKERSKFTVEENNEYKKTDSIHLALFVGNPVSRVSRRIFSFFVNYGNNMSDCLKLLFLNLLELTKLRRPETRRRKDKEYINYILKYLTKPIKIKFQ